MLTSSNIVSRILLLMGSCTSINISFNSALAALNGIDIPNSGLDPVINVLNNIRDTLENVLKGTESLILDMEQHKSEHIANVFGQSQSGDSEKN